jgi:hypothetical protein
MTGDMLPWLTTFLIGVVVLLILLITTVMLHRMVRTETTGFYCPWSQRSVMVRFVSYDEGNPVGVASCTAFADPRVVTCAQHCVCGEEGGEPAALAGGEPRLSA